MNNYIFAVCVGKQNKLHTIVADSFEDAVEKAKEEIDKYFNLDDEVYEILDSNDDWISLRSELQDKGIYLTYLRDIEELFNL